MGTKTVFVRIVAHQISSMLKRHTTMRWSQGRDPPVVLPQLPIPPRNRRIRLVHHQSGGEGGERDVAQQSPGGGAMLGLPRHGFSSALPTLKPNESHRKGKTLLWKYVQL